MTSDNGRDDPRTYSRRSFLGKLSLGLAAIAGAGYFLRGHLLPGGQGNGDSDGEFPSEDSIFHPREDALERMKKRG